MLFYLILLLVLVPILELVVIVEVHSAIADQWGSVTGWLVTIGTIVLTGITGASLARHQGLGVFRKMQKGMRQGETPGQAILDGVLILIGAALLLTPGFLTDLFGFSLLLPFSRTGYRKLVVRWFQGKMVQGTAQFNVVSEEYSSEIPLRDATVHPKDDEENLSE